MINKLSIIIPAYNEEKTISVILDKIISVNLINNIQKEIIVVNDCSKDGTKQSLENYCNFHKDIDIKVYHHEVNQGKGAALHTGIREATGNYLIIQDADNEYDPREFNDLLKPVVEGFADVVYGSRFMGGNPHRILFFWHSIGNKLLTTLSNMFTNLNLSDMETCYKLFRTDIIQSLHLKEKRFGFEPEVTAKIARVPNIRVYEVGISYYGRTYADGKKIGWKDGFRAIWSIFKYNLFKTTPKNSLWYFGALIIIISLSFLYYAPCNYAYYDSDHAIHVLMSKNLSFQRDFFYWGQNRLGSFLPIIAHVLNKFISIHYLYICSIVQYLFLFTGFFILSKQIKSFALKTALCALIFLPINEYNALILIGHPYSSQLFAGVLFVYLLNQLRKYLLSNKLINIKQMLSSLSLSFGAIIFYIIGVWVSEFSAVLILIPATYILIEKKLRNVVLAGFQKRWFILFEILSILFLMFVLFLYKYLKTFFYNDGYDNFFIKNTCDLTKNFYFFLHKLENSLFFKDNATLENSFNWFIILLIVVIIINHLFFNKRVKTKKTILIYSLLITSITSTLLLFLSYWNLRSEFCARYFTPIYVIFCFFLLLSIDSNFYKKWFKFLVLLIFLFFSTGYCYKVIINKKLPGPFELYGEYSKLPKGTLIGDYWDVYKINSIAIDSLQSLPFDNLLVRNWEWRNVALNEDNFYFLNNPEVLQGGLKDTILQFGILFKYSGIKYYCNKTEVLLYHKLLTNCIIKASNNKYLSISSDNLTLTANQPDASLAEYFEITDLGNGKSALKASNGKFICANQQKNMFLFCESDNAWEWETFEIIYINKTTINIKSSTGKFVSADQSFKNVLIANRDEAKEWETFTLERR